MKLGILGGTFNPIHIGHIRLAVEAKEKAELDEIHFIPSYFPPHKIREKVLPFDVRVDFVERSISIFNNFKVSKIEAKRDGPSYTIYTLFSYKEIYPDDILFFILGSKDFVLIDTWYRWGDILKLVNFVVAGSGEDIKLLDNFLKEKIPFARKEKNFLWNLGERLLLYIEIPKLDISSSLVREKLKNNQSVSYLIPPQIEKDLIKFKNFFD